MMACQCPGMPCDHGQTVPLLRIRFPSLILSRHQYCPDLRTRMQLVLVLEAGI